MNMEIWVCMYTLLMFVYVCMYVCICIYIYMLFIMVGGQFVGGVGCFLFFIYEV